ncbi:MAG: putative metal-dependent hydrolase YfiT [Bacteroidia bacterium]|nr:putative metal-dependent hydrolase YfiT [Bacteroidia bacterium]
MDLEQLKYPIGKFKMPADFTSGSINTFISDIENFPSLLRKEVEALNNEQLDTPYRPEGWTIRQVVNHCADSHMNSLIRFKLALTEENPTIKPYFEERWAELADSKTMPVAAALTMLDGLHTRWVVLLKAMTSADFEKTFVHPQSGRIFSLKQTLALYSWHCQHHLAHITTLKNSRNWN